MNTVLLAVALAGLPVEVTPTVTAPMPSQHGRIAAGVSLLAAGWATSIINTSVAYATCEAYLLCFSYAPVWPVGIAVSSLPVIGPAAGIISDVASWSERAQKLSAAPEPQHHVAHHGERGVAGDAANGAGAADHHASRSEDAAFRGHQLRRRAIA